MSSEARCKIHSRSLYFPLTTLISTLWIVNEQPRWFAKKQNQQQKTLKAPLQKPKDPLVLSTILYTKSNIWQYLHHQINNKTKTKEIKTKIKPNSKHKHWWRMTGSNRRPPACKAGALPAELIPQFNLVGLVGLEPTTPALSRRCSNQLSYRPSCSHAYSYLYPLRHSNPTTDKCECLQLLL